MSADRKHLLLVDADEKARRLLELSFKKDGYEVTTANGVVDALTAAHQSAFDLVVTEIALADGDGPTLLEQLAGDEATAALPVMVVTSSEDAAAKARCFELGAAEVLAKPARVKDVLTRAGALVKQREDERLAEANPIQSGDLSETTVVDLVQQMVARDASGAIRIERGDLRGTIYFDEGTIVDAESVRDVGEAALRRMFTWDDGTYTVVTAESSEQARRIDAPTDAVVEDAMTYAAEWADAVAAVGSLSAIYTVEYRSFVAQLGELPAETNSLIRTFDGIRTVEEAIAKSDIDDLTAIQLISPLVDAEVLQLVSSGTTRTTDDGFERLKTNAFKPIVRTAEHEAIAKRRQQDEAERAAREEEERRRAEEEAQRAAELAELEAEQAELDAARRAELEAAQAEAEELRREAEARAAALREQAEARAAELVAREAEIAERRVALTGRMPAIEPAAGDVPDEVAEMRERERQALEREKEDDRSGTLALGSAAVAAAIGESKATPAPRLVEDETDDAHHAGAPAVGHHHAGGATLAMGGAEVARKVAAVEPTVPSPSFAATDAEDNFFSGAHDAIYVDEFEFAEESESDSKPLIIAGIALVAALALVFGLGSMDGPEPTGEEAPPAAAADDSAPAEEEAAEGSGVDAAEEALAAAEAAAEAIRNDLRSRSMQLAEGVAYSAEALAERGEVEDDPEPTPAPARTTAPATARTERPERAERPEREERPTRSASSDEAQAALDDCVSAYNAGNYANTLEACQNAARLNARSSEVYTYLGTANFELGNDSQATNYLERAVQLNRRNTTALVTLGAVRQSSGDFNGAREAYESYLQVNPNGRQAPEIRRILEQEL